METHGVLLRPKVHSVTNVAAIESISGKALFWFGRVPVYLDNDVVFCQISNGSGKAGTGGRQDWSPVSLQDLVLMEKKLNS